VGAPDYSKLAALHLSNGLPGLARRSSSVDDPIPPFRSATSYLQSSFRGEALTAGNFILEDINGRDPGGEVSTLDTLYMAQGGLFQGRPQMTYYHGLDNPETGHTYSKLVFSGFPLWYFRRAHQIALTDFVLQDIWGLVRADVPRDPLHGTGAFAPTASRATPTPGRPVRTARTSR